MECQLHGADCALDEEVLVLEAIYIDELTVSRSDNGHIHEISLVLHPATADETDRQYVKITLVIRLGLEYPEQIPDIFIENPRGLSDSQISCLSEALHLHAESQRGWPMLHELIETAKDTLTAGNIPHCPCAICLDHFTTEDDIYKTTCYHYYHSDCLVEYIDYYKSSMAEKLQSDSLIPCPICRENIEVNIPVVRKKKPVENDGGTYIPDAYIQALQSKMQELYEKQKEKGGIIDIEAEKNKFLVVNGTVLVRPEFVEESEARINEMLQEDAAKALEREANRDDSKRDQGVNKHGRGRYDGGRQDRRRDDRAFLDDRAKVNNSRGKRVDDRSGRRGGGRPHSGADDGFNRGKTRGNYHPGMVNEHANQMAENGSAPRERRSNRNTGGRSERKNDLCQSGEKTLDKPNHNESSDTPSTREHNSNHQRTNKNRRGDSRTYKNQRSHQKNQPDSETSHQNPHRNDFNNKDKFYGSQNSDHYRINERHTDKNQSSNRRAVITSNGYQYCDNTSLNTDLRNNGHVTRNSHEEKNLNGNLDKIDSGQYSRDECVNGTSNEEYERGRRNRRRRAGSNRIERIDTTPVLPLTTDTTPVLPLTTDTTPVLPLTTDTTPVLPLTTNTCPESASGKHTGAQSENMNRRRLNEKVNSKMEDVKYNNDSNRERRNQRRFQSRKHSDSETSEHGVKSDKSDHSVKCDTRVRYETSERGVRSETSDTRVRCETSGRGVMSESNDYLSSMSVSYSRKNAGKIYSPPQNSGGVRTDNNGYPLPYSTRGRGSHRSDRPSSQTHVMGRGFKRRSGGGEGPPRGEVLGSRPGRIRSTELSGNS